MKKSSLIIIVFLSVMMGTSCKKGVADNSAQEQHTQSGAKEEATFVTLLPTTSFNSYSTYWNNFYPWGIDHNGSARMRTQNML